MIRSTGSKYNETVKVETETRGIRNVRANSIVWGAARLTRTKDNVPVEPLQYTVSLATNNFSIVHPTAIRMIRPFPFPPR